MKKYEFVKTMFDAMGRPRVKQSSDRKALTFKGDIAYGISGSLNYRPSKSTGMAWDFKVNKERQIKHLSDIDLLNKRLSKPILFKKDKDYDTIMKKIAKDVKKYKMDTYRPVFKINTFDSLGFGSKSSSDYAQPNYSKQLYPHVSSAPGADVSDKPYIDKVVRNMNNLIKRY